MLDAYAIRKAVPRILIAAIGVNLSIYLCVAAIDITKVVGHGLGSLLTFPFLNNDAWHTVAVQNNGSNALGLAFILGLFGAGFWTIFSGAIIYALPMIAAFLVSAALVMLAILFTLALRQALLIFCVVISPIAIALFVLPGTEKYFKKWLDLFISTLVVYPIITLLFAMSTVMTTVLLGTSNLSPDSIGLAKILSAVVVAFAPLIMIPFAFKLAGGAISAVMNAGHGKANTLSGAARKGMANKVNDPDSIFGKFRQGRQSAVIDRGLTGRQMWARRPGGTDRSGRMQSAKSLDEKMHDAKLQDTQRWKARAQDSDVLDSLVMTDAQVQASRDAQRSILSSTTSTADEKLKARRKLDAHSDADQIGRTSAAAQSAFLSPDRIKFTENTHQQELDNATRLFGQGAAEAMNAHQAIAKGPAGRPDLSGSLYGQTFDPDRAIGSQSTYSLMNQGRPDAVRGLIKQQAEIIADPTKSLDDKAKAASRLHSIRAAKGTGTEGNNQVVNDMSDIIDEHIDDFIRDSATATVAAGGVPSHRKDRVRRTKPDPSNPGETITQIDDISTSITTTDEKVRWAREQAESRMRKDALGYNQPDPSEMP